MLDIPSVVGWAIILGAMAAWEARGMWRNRHGHKGGTLSELVWWVATRFSVTRFLIAATLIWMIIHFVFLGKFG